MKLTFIGADHEVTGSLHVLEACGKKILVDCGMEQGVNIYENMEIPVNIPDIDYVLITHAHIDHVGMLPMLYARGFKGQVFAARATAALCDIMLKDCAHIQESEAEWKARKAKRAGKKAEPPIYTMNDALGVLDLFVPCDYEQKLTLSEGIECRFTDAGHLLGSASIKLWITENEISKTIVFSGDIGNKNKPLIRNPRYMHHADYVIMESTYGDRYHEKCEDRVADFAKIIKETLDKGGNVVIPAFAVGRTQEILNYIRIIKENHMVEGHEGFPVYLDSPMAVEATKIFSENMLDCYNDETRELILKGINPIMFPGLHLSITSDESVQINTDTVPKVIISASGMCDAGRIRHHLKHNLWRQECTVVFAGYQAVGTLGRSLLEGKSEVKLFGEDIEVRARIEKMEGMSGHADKAGLMEWIGSFQGVSQVFVVHGDDEVTEKFAADVKAEFGFETFAPFSGTSYDLAKGEFIEVTQGIPIPKEVKVQASANTGEANWETNWAKKHGLPLSSAGQESGKKKKTLTRSIGIYGMLLEALNRLRGIVRNYEGGANRDLKRLTEEINAVCDKWEQKE